MFKQAKYCNGNVAQYSNPAPHRLGIVLSELVKLSIYEGYFIVICTPEGIGGLAGIFLDTSDPNLERCRPVLSRCLFQRRRWHFSLNGMPLGEEVVWQVYEFFGVQTLEPRQAGDHVVGDNIVEVLRPGRH